MKMWDMHLKLKPVTDRDPPKKKGFSLNSNAFVIRRTFPWSVPGLSVGTTNFRWRMLASDTHARIFKAYQGNRGGVSNFCTRTSILYTSMYQGQVELYLSCNPLSLTVGQSSASSLPFARWNLQMFWTMTIQETNRTITTSSDVH